MTIPANTSQIPDGSPLAIPVYTVDASGKPLSSSNGQSVTVANANPNGQALEAASSPVVLASDQITKEIIGNGTGVVNALNTDLISSTDVSQYSWLSLQITGTYSATLTFQVSNDNVNFLSYPMTLVSGSGWTQNNTASSTSSTNQMWEGPRVGHYFRVRATSFSSNASLSGTLELFDKSPTLPGVQTANTPFAASQGGSTPFHLISAASTNATNIKNSSGQVYGISISNTNAAARYLKVYNKASAPTVGTDTPVVTLEVAANGIRDRQYPMGLALGTGISFATTTGIADSDTGVVGASDLSIDIDWH